MKPQYAPLLTLLVEIAMMHLSWAAMLFSEGQVQEYEIDI